MHDIAEFLRAREPFAALDEGALESLAGRVEVEFFAAGETIFDPGDGTAPRARVVRRGAVELVAGDRVLDLIGEGELFGQASMLSGLPAGLTARAHEDSLCYRLAPGDAELLARPPEVGAPPRPGAAPGGGANTLAAPDVSGRTAGELNPGPAASCGPELPLREVAGRMAEAGSILVIGDEGDLLGILTDRDLRARVIAPGLSLETPVREVMSSPVLSVGSEQSGAEVLLTMLENDVHHVPVVSARGEVLGMLGDLDLLAAQARSPFLLRREIGTAGDGGGLRELAARLGPMVIALAEARMPPAQISETISIVADALVRRMIELAVARRGPPPVEFTWIALGSHGRREAVPSSDVDSGMAWRDPGAGVDPEPVGSYMRGLAEDVTASMREVGWHLDAHGVTAAGIFSAHSISEWRRIIPTWLSAPDDEKVLIATSILLDGRPIRGPAEDLDVQAILLEAAGEAVLHRWLLRLALASKPPTGFRRNLVLWDSGHQRETLDIKHGGLLPIVDIARYAGLRAGSRVTSTPQRLRAGAEGGILDPARARTLEEAHGLFARLRLEHQVRRLAAGEEPDDDLDPDELNPLTRRYLRDAFREVAAVQKSLARGLQNPFADA